MCEDSELAILREMANVAREYFNERNRPAVSWDGMPSVQDQKRRRERIVELLEAVHVPSVISSASPLSEEERGTIKRARQRVSNGEEEYSRHLVASLLETIDRLSASAPSPDKRQAPGFLTDADIASLPEWK